MEVKKLIEKVERIKSEKPEISVKFSEGNRKLGSIPSISLIPVLDCRNCSECSGKCYDLMHDVIYPNVLNNRVINSLAYRTNPESYFRQISDYCQLERFFRWHIGGDIIDRDYFAGVVDVAKKCPHCRFLIFSKCHDIVNDYIRENGRLPSNLRVLFSVWRKAIDNPYNLPTSNIVFRGDERYGKDDYIQAHQYKCTGNCCNCCRSKCGCFYLQKGEKVFFDEH